GLVYGGGKVGLMGEIARAVLAAGGSVVGVIPEHLLAREVGFRELSDLRVVKSMHERKALMAELSDAFIAMPGGCGTIEELFEVITWSQLGLHDKPCAVLDVEGYYAPLLAWLDHAVAERFLRHEQRAVILSSTDPDALLDALARYEAPTVEKWLDKGET
ncbi:MAG TPA: TIGR00730 family Rossman fold protein, partial [Minicystis sp.]|nr:TIGR00730 family Rossman fold protein [Minicystis sp.]